MQPNRAQRRHPVTLAAQRKAAPIIGALMQRFYDNNTFDIYMASGMLIDPRLRRFLGGCERLDAHDHP